MHSNSVKISSCRGFTLIEIMVVVVIIVLLAIVLLAVGSSIRRNSQISATRVELRAVEGLIEQYERESGQSMGTAMTTYYDTNSKTQIKPTSGANYVDVLFRYPATHDQLVKIAGENLKISNTASTTGSAILDSFGNPIAFIAKASVINSMTPPTQDYLRSSGVDGQTNWNSDTAAENADDIFSYEVTK